MRALRLLRKREWASLALLHENGPRLEYGEAINLLRAGMCVTKRTARNIIKRLRSMGYASIAREGDRIVVEVVSPEEAMRKITDSYLSWRKARCRPRG